MIKNSYTCAKSLISQKTCKEYENEYRRNKKKQLNNLAFVVLQENTVETIKPPKLQLKKHSAHEKFQILA